MRTLTIVATVLMSLLLAADAHDGNHELDDWYKSLTNQTGFPCCDGSDAYSVLDPDWDIVGDHYRVRLNGEWLDVPDSAIVKGNNLAGIAKVWPVTNSRTGKTDILCFLPGSGA